MNGNFIINGYPKAVEIDGMQYPIRYDFKVGMKFDEIRDSSLNDEDKLIEMLKLYYPQIPENIKKAIDRMLWFYRCGQDTSENENGRKRYKNRSSEEPAYCFAQDAPYIHAAFMEQYKIDLSQAEMHWWEFMALFESLKEDTKMSRIMYYRKVRTSGLSKDKRAFINEMKKLYRIRDDSSMEKKMSLEDRNRKWREYINKRQKELN